MDNFTHSFTVLYCVYLSRSHSPHWCSAAYSDGATLWRSGHVTLNCKNIIQEYSNNNEMWDKSTWILWIIMKWGAVLWFLGCWDRTMNLMYYNHYIVCSMYNRTLTSSSTVKVCSHRLGTWIHLYCNIMSERNNSSSLSHYKSYQNVNISKIINFTDEPVACTDEAFEWIILVQCRIHITFLLAVIYMES